MKKMSLEDKIWIVTVKEENPSLSQRKLASEFTAKFGRSITKTTIQNVLKERNQIKAFISANPE